MFVQKVSVVVTTSNLVCDFKFGRRLRKKLKSLPTYYASIVEQSHEQLIYDHMSYFNVILNIGDMLFINASFTE